MIKIKNLRKEKPAQPWDVKVDRSSIMGDPFLMFHEADRDSVCDEYEVYFYKLLKNEEFIDEVKRLIFIYEEYGKLNLFCWCAPKRCHAESIKRYIEDQ